MSDDHLHTLYGGPPSVKHHTLIVKKVKWRAIAQGHLASWGIDEAHIFGRDATIEALEAVLAKLEAWLNGRVFPLDFRRRHAPKPEHVQLVAAVFAGDEPRGRAGRQLHLDFPAYDFSYLPIETLSVIYEQFLHSPEKDGKATKGREVGAYYTPIPLVNFMLAEMEDRRPPTDGMKVLDPSCGSGAFLVQCYRRLIEKTLHANSHAPPRPKHLREILEKQIYGVDRDADACSVTELSLTLTLLDYVDPPDLEHAPQFKLPALRNRNIYCIDFFDDRSSSWREFARNRYDWIVGNPPWRKLSQKKLASRDRPVWKWMARHKTDLPVGQYQIARAFAWKAADFLDPGGEISLLLPAMTLFENPARQFRQVFFSRMKVHAVANFSNLRHVLFNGRSIAPAAAFFYKPAHSGEDNPSEWVSAYSPLLLNQELTRTVSEAQGSESWSIVVNASEIRDVALDAVVTGDGLPWKLAAWGSHLDKRLLSRLSRQFPTLEHMEREGRLIVSQGLELRREPTLDDEEEVERVKEVVGKRVLDVKELRTLRYLFTFPPGAIKKVDPGLTFVRKGRAELPLSVCRAPHVIVSESRNFSVYTEDYLVVPPRQTGIFSTTGSKSLLKAIALYLNSDFALYHQFLVSTKLGVERDVATLHTLRQIPLPFAELTSKDLSEWSDLYSRLARTAPRVLGASNTYQMELDWGEGTDDKLDDLLQKLNSLVYDTLAFDEHERTLVHDLVYVRLALNDGGLGKSAVRPPQQQEIRSYAHRLKAQLDAFVGNELPKKHEVGVVYDDLSGMVQVDLIRDIKAARKITVEKADKATKSELTETRRRLLRERAQWVYFNRNLRVYDGTRAFVLKPMQRYHWTESQAMLDAGEIVAETLSRIGDSR